MKLKLFTQQTCPRCPAAKSLVKQVENKFQVENFDIKTEDGLVEALQYDVLATPSIIIINHDDEIVGAWRGEVPQRADLDKIVK